MAPASTLRPPLRVGLLLAQDFTLSAFAGFTDVLRLAADEGDRSRPIRCAWAVLGTGPVRASCGVALAPTGRADPRAAGGWDYLAVVGGLIDEVPRLGAAEAATLRAGAVASVPLIGICTGAFILHELGLMAGRRACVSWFHRDDFLARMGGLEPVSDRIFLDEGDRLTCSGGAASAHLAAHLVARHLGEGPATKALRILMMGPAQPGAAPQPGPAPEAGLPEPADPLVRRALLAMRAAPDAPPRMDVLAARLGVGRRTLERRFEAALGLSPARAARRLRLAEARRMLRQGAGVAQAAAATGFADASHLSRSFRAETGAPPDAWRRAQDV
jgi:transcriptional regulator GlxA family with amidase domain